MSIEPLIPSQNPTIETWLRFTNQPHRFDILMDNTRSSLLPLPVWVSGLPCEQDPLARHVGLLGKILAYMNLEEKPPRYSFLNGLCRWQGEGIGFEDSLPPAAVISKKIEAADRCRFNLVMQQSGLALFGNVLHSINMQQLKAVMIK